MTDRGPVGFGRRPDASGTGDVVRATVVPEGAVRLDDDAAGALLPERPVRGHKGSFGKLLVIAGSLDYAGAALLVCRAGGRTGAGLVTLAVPESLQPLFAAKVVEATTMALPEDDLEEIDAERIARADPRPRARRDRRWSRACGPGSRPSISSTSSSRPATPRRPRSCSTPRRSARSPRWTRGGQGMARHGVLTPHAGEFARLRAGMRRGARIATATSRPTTSRGSRPRRPRRRRGARWSC